MLHSVRISWSPKRQGRFFVIGKATQDFEPSNNVRNWQSSVALSAT